MITRRTFLSSAALSTAASSLYAATGHVKTNAIPGNDLLDRETPSPVVYRPPVPIGMGGVPLGNGFKPTTEAEAVETLEGAWKAGVRYFDTSPWYGLGLSERRYGHFLHTQKRDDYQLSTKVGRILTATKQVPKTMWRDPSPFKYTYDYTAAGVRRSIEDSLQRLGIDSLDMVFIHDLSPDNDDLGNRWMEYFEIARKGAMPELTKMREEGLIKAWGLGVNTIEPILKTLDVASPNLCLSATQYSLMYHQDALDRLFPACDKKGVSIVVGAPLNAGFLAGRDRYDYRGKMPAGYKEKRDRMSQLAIQHGTDLRTAALQFSAAPATVSAVIPGARSAQQVSENMASMTAKIPAEFWTALKKEKLIAANAQTPKAV